MNAMSHRTTTGLTLAALAIVSAPASALEVLPPDTRTTWLRAGNERRPAPLMLDLTARGWLPGTTLWLQTEGDCDHGHGRDDAFLALGLFSSSTTLLASNLQARVPGPAAWMLLPGLLALKMCRRG